MSDLFKPGDRVRSVDETSIDADCRGQVGTIERVNEYEVLVKLDDREIRDGISLRFQPVDLLHHLDVDLSTPEQIDQYLNGG